MEQQTKKRQRTKHFKCEDCGMNYFHKKSLDKHRKNEHGDMSVESPVKRVRIDDAVNNRSVVEEVKTELESSPTNDEIVADDSHVKEEEVKTELESSTDEISPTLYSCDKCETVFTRKDGLDRHHRLARCSVVKDQKKKRSKILDDLIARYSNIGEKERVTGGGGKCGRESFISEKRFDQLSPSIQRPTQWIDLSRGCIYKLSVENDRIVASLTGRDNIVLLVPLPELVVEKLLTAIEEAPSATLYLRPIGADEAILAVVKKLVCERCKMEFNSSGSLYNHRKRYCIIQK